MKKSIKVHQKRQRGRPATGRDPIVSSRIPAATVAAVDEWATRNDATRSDAIRRLVELGLKVKTPAKTVAKPGRKTRARDLAAEAIEKISDPAAPPEERDQRRQRLTKGPAEFRGARVDQPKAKGNDKDAGPV
jgi:hypothetical protein